MRLLATAALLLGLVAYSATAINGSPTAADKLGLPPVGFDAAIYFCTSASVHNENCHGPTSLAEKTALRGRLRADPATAQIKLLSAKNAYTLAKTALPASQYKFLQLGDLPAYYVVALAEPGNITQFLADYQDVAGESTAAPCRVGCSIVALRAAGIVH
jgi:FtsX-like permease family protein